MIFAAYPLPYFFFHWFWGIFYLSGKSAVMLLVYLWMPGHCAFLFSCSFSLSRWHHAFSSLPFLSESKACSVGKKDAHTYTTLKTLHRIVELHLIKGCTRKWEVIYTHAFIKKICSQFDPHEDLNKWINATKKQSDPEALQNPTDCFTAQNIQLSDCEANHASLKWGTKEHQLTNMDANNENVKQTKCFMGNKEIWLTEVKDTWRYLFFFISAKPFIVG